MKWSRQTKREGGQPTWQALVNQLCSLSSLVIAAVVAGVYGLF
jgi:hypothetical protein